MKLVYLFGIYLYHAGIYLAALTGNNKARLWIAGRKAWRKNYEFIPAGNGPVYWFHASSLGEFEQGRPLMEAIRERDSQAKLILTFFSPSGYEVRKNTKLADQVYYLPLDTAANARDFIESIKPDAAFFIKYEFWYHYIRELSDRKIPLYGISCIFRPQQHFFKWYGSFFLDILKRFTHLFVQDTKSKKLLEKHHIDRVSVSGDTRFDRVYASANKRTAIDGLDSFCADSTVLVAGSTWPKDETLLAKCLYQMHTDAIKLIIAPHETDDEHLLAIRNLFTTYFEEDEFLFYSMSEGKIPASVRILVIDSIGLLSQLYFYADYTYIGGGFDKGIHNILEAATFGKIIFFGPVHEKFKEAGDLLKQGAAIRIRHPQELCEQLHRLKKQNEEFRKRSETSRQYIENHRGATDRIIQKLESKNAAI